MTTARKIAITRQATVLQIATVRQIVTIRRAARQRHVFPVVVKVCMDGTALCLVLLTVQTLAATEMMVAAYTGVMGNISVIGVNYVSIRNKLSLCARKSTILLSERTRHRSACAATEAG